MFCITVKDVLKKCNGKLWNGNPDLKLQHFSKDTRTIQPNDVYIGMKGENFDGNAFYIDALKHGASCCILESIDENIWEEKYSDRTIILVEDSILALQQLASYKRNHLNIPVIAVTGSVGKTSTKDMIFEILKQKYSVYKSPGNLNGQIGLPLNILEVQDEEVLVLEMGMNHFGQISKLSQIARPTIGVITNIGTAHIGILGSRENIMKAKMELLDGMDLQSDLVINYDNDLLSSLKLDNYYIHRCSINSKQEYSSFNVIMNDEKTSFQVLYHDKKYQVEIPMVGEAFAMNSLLAIAVGDLLGLTSEQICNGLKNFSLSSNRMEILHLKKNITVINDTYNSNYEALVSALKSLSYYKGKRKIAVLGDVLEMDQYAMDIHKKIGNIPALSKIDAIFLFGEAAKFIKEGAIDQGIDANKIYYFKKKEELIKDLISFIKDEDTILIKASNGMKFIEIVNQLKKEF